MDDAESRGSTRRAALTERPVKLLLVVGGLCGFGPLCVDMYLPALPNIAKDLRTSTSSVQLSLTACLVGITIGQVLFGLLSDRFGRKRPLVIGLVLFVGSSFACALAPGIVALASFRLLQGTGGAAGIVTSNAVVRDLFSGVRAARFFSRLLLVIGLGPVLAPQIGAELLRIASWRGVFVALGILRTLLLLSALTELPETLPLERRHAGGLAETVTGMRDVVTDRKFLANALCFGLGVGAVFCYVSASSFVLENIYGLSPQRFSLVFASNAVGLVFASQVNAHLVGRLGSSRMLSAGVATLAGGSPLLGLAVLFEPKNLLAILPPLFLAVTSVGLIIPNATALALNDFPDSAGSASAVLGVLQFGIGAVVAPLVGLGGSHDARPMALLIALLALGSIGCRVWSVRQTQRPSATVAADDFESYRGLEPPS
ncbi:MAG TPA: multidrug effflux MFS transporter [Acidimicrobiales bacterium]